MKKLIRELRNLNFDITIKEIDGCSFKIIHSYYDDLYGLPLLKCLEIIYNKYKYNAQIVYKDKCLYVFKIRE
jgi:hypothetical protein